MLYAGAQILSYGITPPERNCFSRCSLNATLPAAGWSIFALSAARLSPVFSAGALPSVDNRSADLTAAVGDTSAAGLGCWGSSFLAFTGSAA